MAPGRLAPRQSSTTRCWPSPASNALDTPLNLAGTLQNTGTLIFGTGETITQTGPSATIDSTGPGSEIFNSGTIVANYGGGALAIVPLSFTNFGSIDATGETLTIGYDNNGVRSSWNNNSGTIANATSLVLNGSVTTDNIGAIIGSGAIAEAGLIDNTGATLAVGNGTTLGTVSLISGGTISGGTILDDGDGFVFNGGTLSGVIYQGPLELINPGDHVTIANGLTATVIDLTGSAATLDLAATQTLDNVTLNIGNADGDVLSADQGGTVILGKNASIDSLGAFATLLAEAGTTLDLAGTLTALNGDTVTLADSGGTFRNDGTIAVNGGTIDVNTGLAAVGSGGTIDVANGGVVNVTTSVAADQTVAFADPSGLLQLSDPASFAGTIAGFDLGFHHRSHQLRCHRQELRQQCPDIDQRLQGAGTTAHPGTVQPRRVRADLRWQQWHRHHLDVRAGDLHLDRRQCQLEHAARLGPGLRADRSR